MCSPRWVTELGFVRISSNRKVMRVSTTPSIALGQLAALTGLADHRFWPDDVRMVVGGADGGVVRTHREVTDRHLAALVERYDGRLVTFDVALADSMPTDAVELL